VFVGTGAPKGKELDLPGRRETDQIFIGIEWLESIHFGHVNSIGKRVLIIGVGNTAMDCCRSAKRLGATDVKVIARKTRKYFKASPWELEDAEEEGVEILENLQPVRFIIEQGRLTGVEFDTFRSEETPGSGGGTVLKQEVIGRKTIMIGVYLALVAVTFGMFKAVPGGFVQSQVKQYLVGFAQLPDGATLDRTESVIRHMSDIALKTPGIERAVAFPGLSINGFTNSASDGTVFVTLKPFDERRLGIAVERSLACLHH
jgi:hypothetical protein